MHVLVESVGSKKVCFLEKHVSMRAPSDARGSVHRNRWMCFLVFLNSMFDGKHPAQVDLVNIRLFTGFIHARWCRISSINSINPSVLNMFAFCKSMYNIIVYKKSKYFEILNVFAGAFTYMYHLNYPVFPR